MLFSVWNYNGSSLTGSHRARASYRKAQIEAKRNAEAARRQERELLLGKADGKRRLRGANQLSYVACSPEAE